MRPKNRRLKDLDALASQSSRSRSDVLGSYTGTPADPDDPMPEQDADDL